MELARAWMVLAFGAVACGGTFSSDPSGSGGQGGTGTGGTSTGGAVSTGGRAAGGSAGTVSSGGVGGGAIGLCPTSAPLTGSSCSSEGQVCKYGACCPTTATCTGGKWLVSIPPCVPPTCPTTPPTSGADCTCQDGLSCVYGSCSGGSTQETRAQCAQPVTGGSSTWQVTVASCPTQGVTCGTQVCKPGQICVVTELNIANQYNCTDNPCAPSALDCSCAAKLCSVACQVQGPLDLLCYCPTCG